jgi:dihydrofolate synthase/folylpolyglutamate synthase
MGALTEAVSFSELITILAVSEDKDVPGILDELEPVAAQLVVTRNSSPRSMDAGKLGELASAVFTADRVTVAPRLDDAIDIAVAMADEATAAAGGDPGMPGGAAVLVTGSVVTAGDARVLLTGRGAAGEAATE